MIESVVRDYFKNIPAAISVDLFGSYAENRATDQSDVDTAILCDYLVPEPLTLISWREDLGVLLGKDVDLVCLNTASPIICMQVDVNRRNLRSIKSYYLQTMQN